MTDAEVVYVNEGYPPPSASSALPPQTPFDLFGSSVSVENGSRRRRPRSLSSKRRSSRSASASRSMSPISQSTALRPCCYAFHCDTTADGHVQPPIFASIRAALWDSCLNAITDPGFFMSPVYDPGAAAPSTTNADIANVLHGDCTAASHVRLGSIPPGCPKPPETKPASRNKQRDSSSAQQQKTTRKRRKSTSQASASPAPATEPGSSPQPTSAPTKTSPTRVKMSSSS